MVTGHMYVNGINGEPGLKDFAALLEGKVSNTVHIVVLYHILSKLELRISTTKKWFTYIVIWARILCFFTIA